MQRVASLGSQRNTFRLPDGGGTGTVWTQYGHLASTDVRPGERVNVGQRIGTVGDHPAGSGRAFHLHFEVRTAGLPGTSFPCSRSRGYVTQRYAEPSRFVALNAQAGGPQFRAQWVRQEPDGIFEMAPGEARDLTIAFRNVGTRDWNSNPGHHDYVELRSADGAGEAVPSRLCDASWSEPGAEAGGGCVSVARAHAGNVAPPVGGREGQTGFFTFRARVSNEVPANGQVVNFYFRLWSNEEGLFPDWGEVHFPIRIVAGCRNGTERDVECGDRCGMRGQECVNGRWRDTSDCQDEGCSPGSVQTRACDCGPDRRRSCRNDCSWSGWSQCEACGCQPRPETLNGRDDNCNGRADEPWRPMVRCRHKDGGFRFRDALSRRCFDHPDFVDRNQERSPYFHLAKEEEAGVRLADVEERDVVHLFNLWHGCRGQLLTGSRAERDDVLESRGWSEVTPRWYALAARAQAPRCPNGSVPVYRYADSTQDCNGDGQGDARYLFLPPGRERDGLDDRWQPESGGRPVFCAWPNP